MINRSEISVIVPMFNVADYITPCIASLKAQSFADFDVVIVNDGSTDTSRSVVEQAIANDQRFSIIDQTNRGPGPGGGRNGGLDHTKSDVVLFVDSDDALSPSALSEILAAFRSQPAPDIVSFSASRLAGASIRASHFHDISHPMAEELTTAANSPWLMFDSTPWNKAFRRSFFDRVVSEWPEQQLYEDIAPMTRALLAADHIAVLPQRHYLWRVRGVGSITAQRQDIVGDLAQINQLYSAREAVLEHGNDDLLRWFDWKSLTQDLLWMCRKLASLSPSDRNELHGSMRAMVALIDPALVDATLPPLQRCYRSLLSSSAATTARVTAANRIGLLQDRRTPDTAVHERLAQPVLRRATQDPDGLTLFVRSHTNDLRGARLEIRTTPPWFSPDQRGPCLSVLATSTSRISARFRIEIAALADTDLSSGHDYYLEVVAGDGSRGEILRSLPSALRRRVLGEPLPSGLLAPYIDDGRLRLRRGVLRPTVTEATMADDTIVLSGSLHNSGITHSNDVIVALSRGDEVQYPRWHAEPDGTFRVVLSTEQAKQSGPLPGALSIAHRENPAWTQGIGVTGALSVDLTQDLTLKLTPGAAGEAVLQTSSSVKKRIRQLATDVRALVTSQQ